MLGVEIGGGAKMVELRAAKVAGIAKDIPSATVTGDADADVCRRSSPQGSQASCEATRYEEFVVRWL